MKKYKVIFSAGTEQDFLKMLKEYYCTNEDFTVSDGKITRADGWTPKTIFYRTKKDRHQAVTEV